MCPLSREAEKNMTRELTTRKSCRFVSLPRRERNVTRNISPRLFWRSPPFKRQHFPGRSCYSALDLPSRDTGFQSVGVDETILKNEPIKLYPYAIVFLKFPLESEF